MQRLAFVASFWLSAALAASACGGSDSAATSAATTPDASQDGDPTGDDVTNGDAAADDAADDHSKPKDATSEPFVEAGPFVPAPHPPWPQVPPNAGTTIAQMKLVVVVATGDPLATQLLGFGDALEASAWWPEIGKDYGLQAPSQVVHVTGPAITANPDQTAMQDYLTSAIAGTPAAAADGRTLYMLWLPPGIDAIDPRGPNTGCQYYGGYHTTYGSKGDAWGFGQRCPLTNTGLTDIEWLTMVASHEIAEAASDPVPGNGYTMPTPDTTSPWTQPPWLNAINGEIGDLCFGTQITEGSYVYQRIWSNSAAAKGGDPCAPPHSGVPYVNASVPQGWYTVTAGGSVTIPFAGFSDRATGDWIISQALYTSSATGFAATLNSPTHTTLQGSTYATTNNGRAGTITLTAPAAAAAGTWAIFFLYSQPLAPGGDPYHFWPVGVYIP